VHAEWDMILMSLNSLVLGLLETGVCGDCWSCRRYLSRFGCIMTQLLKDLSSNQLHRSVKPPIFSCFGDIALAIGEHFEKYLIYAMPMLQGAAELSAQPSVGDDEMIDYNNQLRSGIFEAYSGIFQGFKSNKADLMVPYAGHILQFIENVYQDKDKYGSYPFHNLSWSN
jgi:importin subunit beta-1